MALNTKTRFLVMNRTNQAIKPRDENLPGFEAAALKAAGEIPKKYSPSFIREEKAREFAEALALKYGGQNFYVAEVVAGVTATSVAWSEASPVTSLHDESCATGTEADDLDDGTDNE